MEEYRGVIQMAIEDNIGKDPETITDEIFKSIRFAQRLLGKGTSPKPMVSAGLNRLALPQVSMDTSASRDVTAKEFKGAILIGMTPPPAADDGPGGQAEDPNQDYWKSGPTKHDGPERLSAALAKVLPMSITLELPGVENQQVTLVRGLSNPGHPMNWVSVCYTIPGQDLGPRVNIFTYQKSFDVDSILKDISDQAACSYSSNRVAIQPKVQPIAPPTQADIEKLSINGDAGVDPQDAQQSRQLASTWAENRSDRWK